MRLKKSGLARSGLILPFCLLFIWWYGARQGWWNPFLLPSPSLVASAFVSALREGELQRHILASLSRIVKGDERKKSGGAIALNYPAQAR